MRLIVQRVSSASVEVEEFVVSEIGSGLLILAGIEESDTEEDIDWLVKKDLSAADFQRHRRSDEPFGSGYCRKNNCSEPVHLVCQYKKETVLHISGLHVPKRPSRFMSNWLPDSKKYLETKKLKPEFLVPICRFTW